MAGWGENGAGRGGRSLGRLRWHLDPGGLPGDRLIGVELRFGIDVGVEVRRRVGAGIEVPRVGALLGRVARRGQGAVVRWVHRDGSGCGGSKRCR